MRHKKDLIASSDVVALEVFIGKAPVVDDDSELARELRASGRGDARMRRRKPSQRRDVALLPIEIRRAS